MFLRCSRLINCSLKSCLVPKFSAPNNACLLQQNWLRTSVPFYVKGTPVGMPSLSPTMTEGTIIKWHKKEGDKINPGDVICEIQTDKAVVAFEMEDEAVLAKILVPEDTKDIKIGTLIMLTVEEGENWQEVEMPDNVATDAGAPPPASASAPVSSPKPKSEPSSGATEPGHGRHLVGPSVRNLLHHYNIEESQVKATGPKGAILKSDVLDYIKQNNLTPHTEGLKSPAVSHASTKTAVKAAKSVDIELSNIRKIIAKRLTESKSTIPHGYMSADCNMNKLIKLRSEMKKAGASVSVNDFIIKASGLSLKKATGVNVHWNEASGTIEAIPTVDIAVAVATPTGLITPIVKDANSLDVNEISATVRELADRAKQGKLKPHEFQGGSFSISNLGMFGIAEFCAVINPPQSAILAIGGSRLVVNDHGGLEQRMTVTLSYDVRAIEEETAAKFLETFTQLMNDPVSMERSGDGSDNRRLNALVN
ncbi:Pyruvate dehydrogenase protein X component, mitochondrial [Halotydeus destructor]|nr:Pyruvate dehydrogenase protein X component, mitochondrial [Halotydeus destructor]